MIPSVHCSFVRISPFTTCLARSKLLTPSRISSEHKNLKRKLATNIGAVPSSSSCRRQTRYSRSNKASHDHITPRFQIGQPRTASIMGSVQKNDAVAAHCEKDGRDDRETCAATSNDGELNNKYNVNAKCNTEDEIAASKSPNEVIKGRGGRAGGSLTSKNVPYTRSGDKGTAQLFTGERRKKDDDLFEAMGTIDELCSVAGAVYAELIAARDKSGEPTEPADGASDGTYGDLPEQLLDVMSRLFDVGSHIARPAPGNRSREESTKNGPNGSYARHTELLELWIDEMTDRIPELTSFILPTGSLASAQLHVARTVCRRAERRLVPLVHDEGTVRPEALAYVNRLSDYFFTAARFVNYCDGRDEVQYRSGDASAQRERVVVKLKK